jgi:hypothetical protein
MNCACKYDEYDLRTEVCRPCAAGLTQRTRDWFQARCGFATASKAFDITTRNKNGAWSAKRTNYLYHVVAERLTGFPQGMRYVRSLEERSDLEPEARRAYAFYFDRDIREVGFIHHPTIEKAGASPDGYIEHDGLLEIKALDAAQHIKLLEEGPAAQDILDEYWPQVDFGMSCTDKSWCDFVSYCPFMKDEELRLYVRTRHRDENRIIILDDMVKEFLEEVDAKADQIRRRGVNGKEASLLAELTGSIGIVKGEGNLVPIKTKRKRTAVE